MDALNELFSDEQQRTPFLFGFDISKKNHLDIEPYTLEEPLLAYTFLDIQKQINPDSTILLDSLSCIVCHENIVCTGDTSGKVYVIDSNTGNILFILNEHYDQVSCMSFDLTGRFFATSGIDGHLYIYSLRFSEQGLPNGVDIIYQNFNPSQILCLALNPLFAEHDKKTVASGGLSGVVLLHTVDTFHTTVPLQDTCKERILALCWHPDGVVLFWVTDSNVEAFNTRSKCLLSSLSLPYESSTKYASPTIFWMHPDKLVVGNGSAVVILSFESSMSLSAQDLCTEAASMYSSQQSVVSNYKFKTQHTIDMKRPVCGAVPSKIQLSLEKAPVACLSILTCPGEEEYSRTKESNEDVASMVVIHYLSSLEGIVLVSDCIPYSIIQQDNNVNESGSVIKPGDLHLTAQHSTLYILGLKNVIQVTPMKFKQRLKWFLITKQSAKALSLILNEPELLTKVLEYIINDPNQLLLLLRSLQSLKLQENPNVLEIFVEVFKKFDKLHQLILKLPPISSTVPVMENSHIWKRLATSAAMYLIQSRPIFFRDCLDGWLANACPQNLDINTIINEIRLKITTDSSTSVVMKQDTSSTHAIKKRLLLESLSILLQRSNQTEDALSIMLSIGWSSEIFSMLNSYITTDVSLAQRLILSKLYELFYLDYKETINLLTFEHRSSQFGVSAQQNVIFPVSDIASMIGHKRFWFHHYLKTLFYIDPKLCQNFHTQQIALFADYDSSELLDLLRQLKDLNSSSFNAAYALSTCRRKRTELELKLVQCRDNKQELYHQAESEVSDTTHQEVQTRLLYKFSETQNAVEDIIKSIAEIFTAEVFLLFLQNQFLDALKILLDELDDVDAGLELVLSTCRPDLWNYFVGYIKSRPEFLEKILNHLDNKQLLSYSSPAGKMLFDLTTLESTLPVVSVNLIRNLTASSLGKIPELFKRLNKMFTELSDIEALQSLCLNLTENDYSYFSLINKLNQVSGHVVNPELKNHVIELQPECLSYTSSNGNSSSLPTNTSFLDGTGNNVPSDSLGFGLLGLVIRTRLKDNSMYTKNEGTVAQPVIISPSRSSVAHSRLACQLKNEVYLSSEDVESQVVSFWLNKSSFCYLCRNPVEAMTSQNYYSIINLFQCGHVSHVHCQKHVESSEHIIESWLPKDKLREKKSKLLNVDNKEDYFSYCLLCLKTCKTISFPNNILQKQILYKK